MLEDLTDAEQEQRRQLLREWVEERGGHAKVVRDRRLSTSRASHMSQLINGYAFGPRAARTIERDLGMPPRYLEGRSHLILVKGTSQDVIQINSAPGSAEINPNPAILGESEIATLDPLPEEFRTILTDASGGPEFPEQSRILWSTRRTPRIGDVVLVRDRHGQLHIRRMQQGRAPGEWIASPLHPAFALLHSAEDRLTIVAVQDGYQRPPEE